MYSLVLTGYLAADATYNQLKGEKSPINFTVAINFPKKQNPEYKKFVYWIQTKENPEILNRLKKGEGVTVFCNYCDTTSYETEKGTQYTTIEYVDKLVFHKLKGSNSSSDYENNQNIEESVEHDWENLGTV